MPYSGILAGLLFGAATLGNVAATHGATFRWASSSNRIYVTGPGVVTLSGIKAALPKAPLVQVAPGIWHLRANLLIEQGGGLQLYGTSIGGDADELRLQSNNTNDSAFVHISADYGSIDIRSTKVTSWDDAAAGPDTEYYNNGRAFIRVRSSLAADGVTPLEARMDIINSDVGYLGYNASESYGLSWKVIGPAGEDNQLYDQVNVYGNIQTNRIHHNWFGVFTYGSYGMLIQGNEVDNNVKYGLDPHDDSDYLVIEGNHSHHNGNHGIIASQRCDHLLIQNNICEYNNGNGFMLHRACDDSVIANNISRYNNQDGIALFAIWRATVTNNVCLGNAQSGVRLSVGGAENLIANNEMADSPSYGVYIYQGSDDPQPGDNGRPKQNQFLQNYIHDNGAEGVKSGDGDNNLYQGNVFAANGPVLRFARGTGNILDGNTIPADVIVKTEGSPSITANTLFHNTPSVRVQVDSNSSVTFADALGAVFDPEESGLYTTVADTGSLIMLNLASIGTTSTVITRPLLALPDTGLALVNVTAWNEDTLLPKQWRVQAADAIQAISFEVGGLAPGLAYQVLKDGLPLGQYAASAAGDLAFTDVPGSTGMVTYEVAPAP